MEVTVDPEARDRFADLLERFTRGEITTLNFGLAVTEIDASKDPTVGSLARELSFEFSEVIGEDGPIDVSKEFWDFLQRLLVLLRSDAELVVETHWHWSFTQLIAAMCLLVLGAILLEYGDGPTLSITSASLGVVSILLAWIRGRHRQWPPANPATAPFANTAELLATRRTLIGFRKTRYPLHLRIQLVPKSQIVGEVFRWLFIGALWLAFAPIPLLVQTFPISETRVRVVPG